MRLIDADALIQKLYEMKAKEEQYIGLENDVSVMIGSIGFEVMNMTTAYDIDKVVEKLKESSEKFTEYDVEIDDYVSQYAIGIHRAIEIVKQGVKEQK